MRRSAVGCVLLLLIGWSVWMFGTTGVEPYYPRVQYWIDAAKCAQKTGHYLMSCTSSADEKPIEDVSIADDRGHTLILSAASSWFGVEPSIGVLRAINLTINFLGFALFTTLLCFRFGWKSAAFTALLGAYWIGGRVGPDTDAAYIGISLMAMSAILLGVTGLTKNSNGEELAEQTNDDTSKKISLGAMIAAFMLLSFVVLIREPVGLGACLSVAIGAAFLIRRQNYARPLAIIALALIATRMADVPTHIRNFVLHTHSVGIAAHGFSHNLFLGLGGFVENKWGIVWDDNYAAQLMAKLHPEIAYCSPAYYKAIAHLYWSYVSADPLEAARIYMIKTARVFSVHGKLALPPSITLTICAALLFWARRRRAQLSPQQKLTVLTIGLFGFSFLAQGVLTHPAWSYVHPGPVILMIAVAMCADGLFSQRTKI